MHEIRDPLPGSGVPQYQIVASVAVQVTDAAQFERRVFRDAEPLAEHNPRRGVRSLHGVVVEPRPVVPSLEQHVVAPVAVEVADGHEAVQVVGGQGQRVPFRARIGQHVVAPLAGRLVAQQEFVAPVTVEVTGTVTPCCVLANEDNGSSRRE